MASQADRRAATVGTILAEARRLFTERGFEATSIDDIAAAAGVAKGAVYHHFASKEAVFERVLEDVQAEIAAAPVPPEPLARGDAAEQIAAATLRYLLAASEPAVRRVLLIDGPAVIGWRRWREIDDRFFGAGARLAMTWLLGPDSPDREVDALTHLLMGAVMEAALVCATADDPAEAARALSSALGRMLGGLAARR
ncbi:MAG TPA: helix-turn-helix domain-containing protein [Stellaceae bacterium]|jgi:AcrR family transcriptional regulator|nr:helix-turn-helix domain-containing protein [Stellaceae bacterium]